MLQSTVHTTLGATPMQLVFGQDAVLNLSHEANWQYQTPKKELINKTTKRLQKLDDPTPMPESALLMATAQIMAEGGAKHSPVNCNTVNSMIDCAASKKAKSGAARKRGANLCFCAAAR